MSSTGPVTGWIGELKAGDPAAAQGLWEAYFRRLVGLARQRLQGAPRQVADEEDVALSAFASFCKGAERGRYPDLRDRHDLWHLLVVITARKAANQLRYHHRQKRGGAVQGKGGPASEVAGEEVVLDQLVGREPTPEFAAQVAEEHQRRLDALGDPELRSIALWKMEGDTTNEIAAKLRRAPRTVERKLELIRSLWARELPP
jgi:DNA-directed RNA polymerase specialized sigma24 family protein